MTKELSLILASAALLLTGCTDDGDGMTGSTSGSSTGEPTTGEPATGGPTTGGPTTDEPTTDEPTTGDESSSGGAEEPTVFDVVVENVSEPSPVFGAGAFTVPLGADEAAAAFPGESFEIQFGAAPGHYLSFATMFVQSNDFFIAPAPEGIPLFDRSGNARTGDITDALEIWDAGTEEDEEPGVGENQAPRQDGPNMGAEDDDTAIRLASGEFPDLPEMTALVDASLAYDGEGVFTLTIENVSTMETLVHSNGSNGVPLSPGAIMIHSDEVTFFEVGGEASAGLQGLAEDGDPGVMAAAIGEMVGLAVPLAPGVFVTHMEGAPLFATGENDRGDGLEALAEDGDPAALGEVLAANFDVSGVFNTPDGADEPGPLLPGGSYSFEVTALAGDALSLATMFVHSNDLFFAPADAGIPLFDGDGAPISGDVTDQLSLWDAGTEDNQWPGAGPDQAPRQSGPNTGGGRNASVNLVDDGYMYQTPVIRVTVTPVAQ